MRYHLTPSALASAFVCLLAASCANLPSELRVPTPPHELAIAAAVEAFEAAREPAPCELLDRAMVAVMDHAELQRWCAALTRETAGCVYFPVYRNVFEHNQPRAAIYLSDALDEAGLVRGLQHEVLHVTRACWVFDARMGPPDEYLGRLRRGATEDCRIRYQSDHNHCDSEVWGPIASDAFERWRAAQ